MPACFGCSPNADSIKVMARTCVKCGEGFGFQDVPFGYKDLYVHTWHFDTLSECDAYLKGLHAAEPVDADKQTIESDETH